MLLMRITWVLLPLVKTNDFDREKEGDRPPDTALSSQKDTALGAIALHSTALSPKGTRTRVRAIALPRSKIAQLSPYIEKFF